ncbi:MAG: SRPBCC family protein [Erythrobacter sp.]|jgi:hypothetical protein|nr:SRPBCC family protein [Erythrobacter sp.]
MRNHTFLAAISNGAFLALLAGFPARAEITAESDRGFVTRHEVVLEASPKETWLALISPARWWNAQHTWSGDAENLTLTPQAGGCFCETIPEVDEPGRFTLQGSVEHMRVVQANPENALRMVGALGPLQSEPVTGVLTIALTPIEGEGGAAHTRVVWEYNVGGSMRYEVPVIAKAVDGVMGLQVEGLGALLGVIGGEEMGAGAEDGAEDAPSETSSDAPAVIDPDSVLEVADDKPPEMTAPASVDEAFGDFGGPDG